MTNTKRDWSIPTDLIKAVQGKGITFLVGAGASQDSPARVPAWAQLAVLLDNEIGENQTYRFDVNKHDPAKYIWERIKEESTRRDWIIDKIEEVAERTENERKIPSTLHEKLMHMAWRRGGENALVLTTNYDLLLEAAAERGSDWLNSPTQWTGQANGKAAAARGIYHLHGTLENREGILLTDAEMQRHYEAEGNIHSRHLQEIFRDRVILAIGYRFTDPEIGKILRRISEDSFGKMFAIIEEKPNGGRPELPAHVNGIMYKNGHHDEVKRILDRIEEMAVTRSAVAQAKARQETGRKGPGSATPQTWEQIGKWIESGNEQLDHFLRGTKEAKNTDEWISIEMLEAGLFGVFRIKELSEGERKLCIWLASNLTGKRLRKIIWAKAFAGGPMHPELQFRLGQQLQDEDRSFSIEDLRLGIEVLCSQGIIGGLNDSLSLMLGLIAERLQKMDPSETETGLEVFRVLTEVVAQPDKRWRYGENSQATEAGAPLIAVSRSDGQTIEKAWKKTGTRLVEDVPEELWEIASTALRRQQRITDIGGGKRNSFNRWEFSLPSIEKRDQLPDWDKGGRYVLLDAASRGISKLGHIPEKKKRWAACVERAIKEDSPLLRRITVDSVRTTTHWNADRKLAWIAKQDRMNDWHTWREKYFLVKQSWHRANKKTKESAARAISKMVQKWGYEKQKDEKISDFWRADMISWLKNNGVEYPIMEMELNSLLEKYPHIASQIGEEDRSSGGLIVHRFEPISPKSADDLINEWKEQGNEVLDKLVDQWFASIDDVDWSTGPNREGATKALEEAVAMCANYGLTLSRKLSERQLWGHWAWEGLTKAMPKHIDTLAGQTWLEETNWTAISEGNAEVHLEEMLYFSSQYARDEEWSNEAIEALYNSLKREMKTNVKADRKRKIISDNYSGALEQAINEPEGKVINAIMTLWKLQVKREKAGSAGKQLNSREMIAVVGDLAAREDTYAQIYATVLLARDYEIARQEAPGVVERVLHRKLESKEPLWRNVVWDGLWYCNDWTHGQMGESLKTAMRKDLFEHEVPPGTSWRRSEDDQVADKYGLIMALKVWYEKEDYMDEWQIGKITKMRRQAVVTSICQIFDRTEAMHKDGWEKLISPLWEDIAGESGTETTEEEQRAMTACFRHLNKLDQNEFAIRFLAGPATAPERLIGHLDKNPNIANREAALRILIHCSEDRPSQNPRSTGFGDWHHILNVVQRHWSDTDVGIEKELIDQLLSLHGRKI